MKCFENLLAFILGLGLFSALIQFPIYVRLLLGMHREKVYA